MAGALLVLGAGFLVANVRLIVQYVRYLRRRHGMLLGWPSPAPPYYRTKLGIGIAIGVLLVYNLAVLHRQAFGESMMFLYYAYLFPLSLRIRRGFYEDGIWADSTFIPYNEVGGLTWQEGKHAASLIVISRLRSLARRLVVPLEHYAAARKLLRDKIGAHEIHFQGTGLDLGEHDERDEA